LLYKSATSPASPETSVTFAMLNAAAGKRTDMSANELTRELECITNYEGYAYYEIPSDPARYGKETAEELQQLVANYLVLLAGQTDDSKANDPLEPTTQPPCAMDAASIMQTAFPMFPQALQKKYPQGSV
jgi:hypothetical protein